MIAVNSSIRLSSHFLCLGLRKTVGRKRSVKLDAPLLGTYLLYLVRACSARLSVSVCLSLSRSQTASVILQRAPWWLGQIEHRAGQGWLAVDCLLLLFASCPCHTPSLLISLDRNPRPNMGDRPLFLFSLSRPYCDKKKLVSNTFCCTGSKKCSSSMT